MCTVLPRCYKVLRGFQHCALPPLLNAPLLHTHKYKDTRANIYIKYVFIIYIKNKKIYILEPRARYARA